jgi:hypothetical protein
MHIISIDIDFHCLKFVRYDLKTSHGCDRNFARPISIVLFSCFPKVYVALLSLTLRSENWNKNTAAVLDNPAEIIKCPVRFVSRHYNGEKCHNVQVAKEFFENMAKLKYEGTKSK